MHCIKFNNELLIYCAGYIIIIVRDCGITSTLTGKTIHFIDHEQDIVNNAAACRLTKKWLRTSLQRQNPPGQQKLDSKNNR